MTKAIVNLNSDNYKVKPKTFYLHIPLLVNLTLNWGLLSLGFIYG